MAAEVHIAYPTPDATVPGAGGLFAWGDVTELAPETAQASLNPNDGTVTKVDAPSPCTWAFRLDGLTQGREYTLTVSADDMMGGDPVPKSVTFTIGAF
jgi:hypothetical protein